MIIIDRRQDPSTIYFADLEYGDVFQDEDKDVCIKVDNDLSVFNAVVLTTGVAFCCSMDTPVIPLNAELTVRNK